MDDKMFKMAFSKVYPLYVRKAEAKGRTRAEVDQVIFWLTGYDAKALKKQLDRNADFETFYNEAPRFNPDASKITGVICGYRVEEIADPLAQRIRYLDKLVDELARGKPMEKVLRSEAAGEAAAPRKAPARRSAKAPARKPKKAPARKRNGRPAAA